MLAEVCDGVYSFPLFSADFCQHLISCSLSFDEYLARNNIESLVGAKMLDLMDLRYTSRDVNEVEHPETLNSDPQPQTGGSTTFCLKPWLRRSHR